MILINYRLVLDYICSYNYIFGEIIIKVFCNGYGTATILNKILNKLIGILFSEVRKKQYSHLQHLFNLAEREKKEKHCIYGMNPRR